MPSIPRRQAESEIYHVVCRGVGKQIIFESDVDRGYYLTILGKGLKASDGDLLAWCLMDNHVHLLLQISFEGLSSLMRAVNSEYAMFFNRRYERVGHLFQGRFRSEPVETDEYLLTVVRYIHQNPLRGGICATCDYPWSSYGVFVGGVDRFRILNPRPVLEAFGGVGEFIRFHDESDVGARCIDADRVWGRMGDEEAALLAREVLGGRSVGEVASFPRERRDAAICALRSLGLSVRQVERLTGVSRGVISRVRGTVTPVGQKPPG